MNSVYEQIRAHCARIADQEPVVQALLPEPDREARLRVDADALHTRWPDPATRPPLFGMLAGIKDIFHVSGWVTRAGSAVSPAAFAGPEAEVVTRWKDQGVLILGKTAATEFAFSEPGPTRNPRNPNHTPGGSSSGSAAAVAADYCPLALGTQTIGSISRPAAYCGVVGFKPTYGRVPLTGCVPFAPSVDHAGWFTPDLTTAQTVAAATCPDWQSVSPPARPLIIGYPTGAYLREADPTMPALCERVLAERTAAGHTVRAIDLFPDWPDWVGLHYDLIAAEMAAVHAPWFEAERAHYRAGTRALIERGQAITAQRVAAARAGRAALRQRIEDVMKAESIDGWISPAATGPAPAGLGSTGSPLMNLPWSYTGLPTITWPAGQAPNGLPLGLQWTGRFGADEMVFQHVSAYMMPSVTLPR